MTTIPSSTDSSNSSTKAAIAFAVVAIGKTLEIFYHRRKRLAKPAPPRPSFLKFRFANGASAKARLLWNKAPKTCAAVVATLPLETWSWHGRNSGAEALFLTPRVISDVPQDDTENATTGVLCVVCLDWLLTRMYCRKKERLLHCAEHRLGNVAFGYEPAGFCHGGASDKGCSEVVWFYGEAAQACFWVSEKGPPHDVGPYHRQPANINVFAQIVEEDGFYTASSRLARYGQRRLSISCE